MWEKQHLPNLFLKLFNDFSFLSQQYHYYKQGPRCHASDTGIAIVSNNESRLISI